MERKTESGDIAMLIDFSSPVSNRSLHTPLIPVPTTVSHIPVSPSNTNPFDIVVKQTICQATIENDPFECATKSAVSTLNTPNDKNNSFESPRNNQISEPVKDERVSIEGVPTIEKYKENCDNRVIEEFENTNNLLDISVVDKEITTLESKPSALLRCGDDNVSQVSADFSTEEGIKATIAKRVNKCIQKVLSDSMIKTKLDLPKNNRKSSSFTTSSATNKVCDRLNKSCSESTFNNDSYLELKTPESSVYSSDATPSSILLGEDLQNSESLILISDKDEVFQEANKLARTFSRMAESFSKIKEVENDDDLLSCKPQWLYADSSEDEDEKLKNDPALNIRVSFTSSKAKDEPDSDALSAFKRRSFSQLQSNISQNESSFKRSLSIGSKPAIAPVAPNVVSTPVPLIIGKHDDNILKLKKKPMGELRKGPMKAVMPVQNMTKESLTSDVQLSRKTATSPVRKMSSAQIMISPIKDTSQLSMLPVASSTPNKCNIASPHIALPKNKRRSLGSTNENRKSRNLVVDSRFRQRSSSANSSSSTLVPLPARALGPKSVSNLMKPTTPKINAHQDKVCEKKLEKHLKPNFNPNALNEVKSKITRPSKVKSTVNAISTMITGKSKKAALRDKENRFPA